MTAQSEKAAPNPGEAAADSLTTEVPEVGARPARWKGEEPGDDGRLDSPEAVTEADVEGAVPESTTTITKRQWRGKPQRFEARKVHRLIRHIDPWSTAKFALVFFFAVWVMTMVAALIVWSIAERAGTIGNIESFLQGLGLKDADIDGRFYVRGLGLVGLVLTFAFSAGSIVAAMVFNLISDIIGGIWITVIEEESARPVSGSPDPSDVG